MFVSQGRRISFLKHLCCARPGVAPHTHLCAVHQLELLKIPAEGAPAPFPIGPSHQPSPGCDSGRLALLRPCALAWSFKRHEVCSQAQRGTQLAIPKQASKDPVPISMPLLSINTIHGDCRHPCDYRNNPGSVWGCLKPTSLNVPSLTGVI